MNRTIAILATLMIALPTTLPVAAATDEYRATAAGGGQGEACRNVLGSDDCEAHKAAAFVTTNLVACVPESGSGLNTRFACTLQYALVLVVTGTTVGCGYAYTEPTGYDIGCNFLAPLPYRTSPPKEGEWTHHDIPFGKTTVTMPGIVCADHFLLIENCVPFPINTDIVITSSGIDIPDPFALLENLLRKAPDAEVVVEDVL